MELQLNEVEIRVLGSLVEKDMSTPEYYPLSLNALVNACNQKSNREPTVNYDEQTVQAGLAGLRAKGLLQAVSGAGMRVEKYGHRLTERFNFNNRELALLCVLMLRGPQTLGELRDRTERLHRFDDVDAVESCLTRLMERQPDPLVKKLPKATGYKEPRYAHLLAGDVGVFEPPEPAVRPAALSGERIERLESEIAELRQIVQSLEARFADFRRQFE